MGAAVKQYSDIPEGFHPYSDVPEGFTVAPPQDRQTPGDVSAAQALIRKYSGVNDNRTTYEVARDQYAKVGEGAVKIATHPLDNLVIPGVKAGAGIVRDLATNPKTLTNPVQSFMESKTAQDVLKGVMQPATVAARGAGAYVAPGSVQAPSRQEFEQQAEGAGANAAGLLVGEAAAKVSPYVNRAVAATPETVRQGLNAVTTPEARMQSAGEMRQNVQPIARTASDFLKAAGNANPLDAAASVVKGGTDVIRRGAIPANEALARFMTAKDAVPIPAERMPVVENANYQGPQYADQVTAGSGYRTGMDMEANHPPSYTPPDEPAANPNYKAPPQGPPPKTPNFIMDDIRKMGQQAPPELDAPTLNKWMGAKSANMMRGADPGARLVSEKLVGADKATTAANVKSAVGTAGADLESALKAADSTGATINGKGIIDDAIADARKPFAESTDEAFMKKMDQITADANALFEDTSKLKPSEAHALKKTVGNAIDWKTADSTPFNNVLKKIYRSLNDGLGDVDSNIRKTQLRWQDLNQALNSLEESLVKDRAGRGTGAALPAPSAADRLRGRMAPSRQSVKSR